MDDDDGDVWRGVRMPFPKHCSRDLVNMLEMVRGVCEYAGDGCTNGFCGNFDFSFIFPLNCVMMVDPNLGCYLVFSMSC